MTTCSHSTKRKLFAARDYVTGDEFAVCACDACGLAVTDPQPSGAALAAYYPPAYYRTTRGRRFPAVVEALQRLLYAGRARAIERLAGRPGRVLDVGCGPGWLLDAFRRRGWDVQGTELTDASAAHAREVLDIPVHVGPPETWPPGMDAVVLWHVLEHWPDPHVPLARACELLRPGGVLMVGVPNMASLEARIARDRWFHLDVPRHLVHVTPAWLEREARALGLDPRRTSFFAPEFDAFSFVQSALNLAGFPHNLLYDLLRGRGAKLLGGAGALQKLAVVAAAVPLAAASLPATLALDLARSGSSVTMYFTKPAP